MNPTVLSWRARAPRALALMVLMPFMAAQAGTVRQGNWEPSGCGDKPAAPSIDLKDADAYNRSVDGINLYRKAIRSYLDCLVKEANTDIQAVSQSANQIQKQAQEAEDKILADVKKAEEKFK